MLAWMHDRMGQPKRATKLRSELGRLKSLDRAP
jgi:hypothetical protein